MRAHPIKTGDGLLTYLGELSEAKYEGSTWTNASAPADFSWDRKYLGAEAYEYLKHRNFKIAGTRDETREHIRSFLARSGMDGELVEMDYKNDQMMARFNLKFLVDQDLGDGLVYPLHMGIQSCREDIAIRMANVIFYPEGTEAMTEDEIREAVDKGEIVLPKGSSFEEDGQTVQMPLHDGQYDIGSTRAIDPHGWPQFFLGGKRVLTQLQQRKTNASNFLRSGFDIRDIQLFATDKYRLILERETTRPGVVHLNSPEMQLNEHVPRHVEFSFDPEATILTKDVRVRGRFYKMDEKDTSMSVTVPKMPEASNGNGVLPSSLDSRLAVSSGSIQHYLKLLETYQSKGLEGVVIGADKIMPLPKDPDSSLINWATVAAKQNRPLDIRPLDEIGSEIIQDISNHPGAQAISEAIRNGSSHNITHALVSRTLPNATDVQSLVRDSGTGIGIYFATKLQQLGSPEDDSGPGGFDNLSLGTKELEIYSTLCRDRDARIFWLPPEHPNCESEIRELIGISFVKLSSVEFFKNMDFVLTVYCSHIKAEEFDAEFEKQMGEFLNALNNLGLKFGLATGASTGLMQKTTLAAKECSNIQSIGISTLFHDQTPDLTPEILTICADGHREYRQTLLTKMGDARLALNGGFGTTGEIIEDCTTSKFGHVVPAPIGAVDLAKLQNWIHLKNHCKQITTAPENSPMADPWCARLIRDNSNLMGFFNEDLEPFINNPIGWWKKIGVPPQIIRHGLESQIANAEYTGRPVSPVFAHAIEKYGIAPK